MSTHGLELDGAVAKSVIQSGFVLADLISVKEQCNSSALN